MNDRIMRALDGEISADQLTPEERAELQHYRAAICTALAPVQHLASIDVESAVMCRVAPEPGPVRRRLGAAIRWLWSPHALTVRPAFAMAGALALAVVISIYGSDTAPTATPGQARMVVQFRLGAVEAQEVALMGDFNGWRPAHRLHQIAAGVWSVDLALEPGVYNYVFVVNGNTWQLDPLAPKVTDGFGGASSRVAVLAPEVRS